MKFNETMLYKVLSIPGIELGKSCRYVFVLKIPILIVMMLVGIPCAIVLDFFYVASKLGGVD